MSCAGKGAELGLEEWLSHEVVRPFSEKNTLKP